MNATDWTALFDTVANLAVAALLQCTAATALALVLVSSLRHKAAARQVVLRSTVVCVLCCPLVSLAARSAGVTWLNVFADSSPGAPSHQAAPEIVDLRAGHLEDFEKPDAFDLPERSASNAAISSPSNDAPVLGQNPQARRNQVRPNAMAAAAPPAAVFQLNRRSLSVGLLVWGAGTTLCLLGIARGAWKLGKILRGAGERDRRALRPLVESLCQELRLGRAPRLLSTSAVERPMSAGVVRPAIMLPIGFTRKLNSRDVRCVLLHELAHVLRRDHAALLAEQLVLACFWFHPLVHWLKRQSGRAREETCDNFVLSRVDRVSYSETLLRVARLFPFTSPLTGGTGLLDKRWSLEERITGLLAQRRNTMTRVNLFTSSAFLLALAAGITLLGAASWAAPQGEAPSPGDQQDGLVAASPTDDSATTGLRVTVPGATSSGVPDIEWGDESNFSFYVGFAGENSDRRAVNQFYFDVPATRAHRYQAASPDGRVAYVDIQRVFESSSAFNQRREALKQAVESVSREQRAEQEQIKTLHQAVQAISNDNDAKAELEALIDAKTSEVKQKTAKARANFLEREAAMYYEFYQVITAAIGDHAAEHGIDVVLRRKAPSTSSRETAAQKQSAKGRDVLKIIHQPILYMRHDNDFREDITDAIIERVESNTK